MFSDTPCSKCGKMERILIDRYDAWACIYCNEWEEPVCGDAKCPFCKNRPDTPYEVYWFKRESPDDALMRKDWRRHNYQHKKSGRIRHEKSGCDETGTILRKDK